MLNLCDQIAINCLATRHIRPNKLSFYLISQPGNLSYSMTEIQNCWVGGSFYCEEEV